MTDHLEPYRKMARSLRFVPSQGPVEPAYRQLTKLSKLEASTPAMVADPQATAIAAGWTAPDVAAPTPPVDPSQRAEELIRAAVAKPTILPVTYHLLENIGDRISKMAPARPPQAEPWTPKIPQPGALGWVPTSPTPAPEPAAAEPASTPDAAPGQEQETAGTTADEAAAVQPAASPAQPTPSRAATSTSTGRKASKTRSKSRRSRSSRKS